MYLFLNGRCVPQAEAKVSIFDHGFLYGIGLFETFRTFNGHPFLLSEHLDRLESGCHELNIKWHRNDRKLMQQITSLLQKNNLQDGYFRLNVTAGEHPIGLSKEAYTDVTEALLVKELPQPVHDKKLTTVQTRRNTPEGPTRLKSHHFINNHYANLEVPAGNEGVFLNGKHLLAEGIVSNIFFIKDHKLYTLHVNTGILNGITRQWVIQKAQALGWHVLEGEYTLPFAQEAQEVFITNSIQGVVPVSQWDQYSYCLNTNDMTQEIHTHYNQHLTNHNLG